MPDGLTHTVLRQAGTRHKVHDAHLRFKLQADLTNIPCTFLDYCKEVSRGITKEEQEALTQSLQQEKMDWYHRLYHLSFSKKSDYREGLSSKSATLMQKNANPLNCVQIWDHSLSSLACVQ
jgi:hypothetical protein